MIVVPGVICVAGIVARVVTRVVDAFAKAIDVPVSVDIFEDAALVVGRW